MTDFSRIARPNFLYKIMHVYLGVALRFIYYRKFLTVGRENLPSDKKEGFLLICNHQNGLLDALNIIYAIEPREPVFLARGDIFENPTLAKILRSLRILPAYRKRDVGVENLDRNNAIFEQSVQLIDDGVVVALFPEAGHQTHHYLGTFKKGFARIAFGYEEACNFARDLKIVPLGHHYCGYSGMWNDVLFTIGEPFTFSDLYDTYKEHPERGRYLLTQRARASVEKLMLDVREPDNYMAVEQLCQMYVPVWEKSNGQRRGSLKNNLAASQRLNAALRCSDYGRQEAPADAALSRSAAQQLIDKAVRYTANLKELGVSDYVVERASTAGFIGRTLLWILLLPLFALSAVINFVPHRLSVAISQKVKDKMLVPSLQLGVGIFAFFVWYLILFALVWIFSKKFWIALLALLLLPASMLAYHNLRMLSRRLVERLRKYRYKLGHNKLFSETQRLRRDIISGLDALKLCLDL